MPADSDPYELTQLFHEHASGLTGAVRGVLGARADVAEILQEVFLKAWRAMERGTEPQDPLAWIFALTLNHARDVRRKRQRRGPAIDLEEVDSMKLASNGPQPDAALAQAETLGAARTAIGRLSDDQREVFLMRSSAELTFDAIASALGIPVGTAKTRMRAALGSLRLALASHDPNQHNAASQGGTR